MGRLGQLGPPHFLYNHPSALRTRVPTFCTITRPPRAHAYGGNSHQPAHTQTNSAPSTQQSTPKAPADQGEMPKEQQEKKSGGVKCFLCGLEGHMFRNCPYRWHSSTLFLWCCGFLVPWFSSSIVLYLSCFLF